MPPPTAAPGPPSPPGPPPTSPPLRPPIRTGGCRPPRPRLRPAPCPTATTGTVACATSSSAACPPSSPTRSIIARPTRLSTSSKAPPPALIGSLGLGGLRGNGVAGGRGPGDGCVFIKRCATILIADVGLGRGDGPQGGLLQPLLIPRAPHLSALGADVHPKWKDLRARTWRHRGMGRGAAPPPSSAKPPPSAPLLLPTWCCRESGAGGRHYREGGAQAGPGMGEH